MTDGSENDAYRPTCPKCGYSLTYDPQSRTLTCGSCCSKFDADTIKADREFSYERKTWKPGEAVLYSCPSCGAHIIYGKEDITARCAYCESNLVLEHNLSGMMKPNSIIPFKIDEKTAAGAVMEHLRNSGMSRRSIEKCTVSNVHGMYVPFWTYSASLQADGVLKYKEKVGKITHIFSRYLVASADYQSVPQDASYRIPNDATESLEPFDFTEAVEFNPSYLSGFAAERYDLEPGDLFHRARQRMSDDMQRFFLEMYADSTDSYMESMHTYTPTTVVRYTLCPIWFVFVKYKDDVYRFYVNGQTGRATGEIPVNVVKNRKMTISTLIALQIVPLSMLFLTSGIMTAVSFIITEVPIMAATLYFIKRYKRSRRVHLCDGAGYYRKRGSERIL